MMTGSWFILSLIIAAWGIALIGLGLRGRKIDDHPICRKCRFDLVGVCGVQAIASWVNE
ncbi:MAG: hypothetical protein IT436_18090 [Phycisphaerales bacterium]|nr:hypothetical protein [Phycisphaerales bacterium]